MKKLIMWIGTGALAISLIYGCGPSKKEQQRREQARQDSLAKVRKQQRQDSLAQIRADSIATAKKMAEKQNKQQKKKEEQANLQAHGKYIVYGPSWRSKQKAQTQASKWAKRGFAHSTVYKHGNGKNGNVWFRVVLGRTDNKQDAQKVKQQVKQKYQTNTWIAQAS